VAARLRLVGRVDLGEAAARRRVDLFKVLSVYNFSFWFDGAVARVVLELEPPAVAVVSVKGEAALYAQEGSDPAELEGRLAAALGLAEDTSGFLQVASGDPLLAPFAREWGGWRVRSSSLWWALLVAVCQQNASFRQGWSMLARLVRSYGRRAELEGAGEVLLPPTHRDVLGDPSRLAASGLGYRARTVVGVAEALSSGRVPPEEELARVGAEEAEALLRSVRGVGSYTARLALALSLRRYELPPIDRWVRAIASRAYGVGEGEVELEWRRRWGRWSALAVLALTVALDAAPLRKALERLESGRLLPEPGEVSPAQLWRYY
jgi:N-glycosylase/DNA lyase